MRFDLGLFLVLMAGLATLLGTMVLCAFVNSVAGLVFFFVGLSVLLCVT